MHAHAGLCAIAAAPVGSSMGTFSAAGRTFEAVFGPAELLAALRQPDADDLRAQQASFDHRCIVIARCLQDQRPYAAWEFYTTGDGPPMRSKALDVDCNHKQQGIGKAFRAAVLQHLAIGPSGAYTAEGAAFMNAVAPG